MRLCLVLAVLLTSISYSTHKTFNNEKIIEQSFFKLTTSNGLIVAVYDSKKMLIEYVFPHIFSNYDSAKFVEPFVGNIKLNTSELPSVIKYLSNTHIIQAQYKNYNVNYFSSKPIQSTQSSLNIKPTNSNIFVTNTNLHKE